MEDDEERTFLCGRSRFPPAHRRFQRAGLDVSGQAEVRDQGGRQKFKVSMDARVANGTTFIVMANGAATGTVTIVAGIRLPLRGRYN